MRTRLPLALWLAATAGAVTALVVGCGERAQPLEPAGSADVATPAAVVQGATTGRVTLDDLWPNEDGRRWEYQLLAGLCEPPQPAIFPDSASVPPAPGLEVLLPLLGGRHRGSAPPAGPSVACLGVMERFALQFKGSVTTMPGVTAQNLEEQWAEVSPSSRLGTSAGWSARLLARLALARPDLRAKLRAAWPGTPVPPPAPGLMRPLFLHGGAWEKTAEYIGTYGDVDRFLAWKFLDADFSRGSSFVFQLLPSFTSDLFLHAWVVPRSRQARLQGFARELQVVYEVDYGISEMRDNVGTLLGYSRPIDYGTVFYVPGVGPVQCYERFFGWAGDPGATTAQNLITLIRVTPGPGPIAGTLE